TAAPVAKETVVAEASVEIPSAPVPELIVNAPLVAVRLNAPLPDLIAVDEVELVEPIINVFCDLFAGRRDVLLLIKDRNSTKEYQQWVNKKKIKYNANIEYINEHWKSREQIITFFESVDIHCYLNYSSTWALPCIQGLKMGIPTITMAYSGPATYCNDENSILVDYSLDYVTKDIQYLTSIGCRNYFFLDGYKTNPVWAKPNINDLSNKMKWAYSNRNNLRKIYAKKAIDTANSYSWSNSVISLVSILKKWF
ncbi:MAG: hypothetical protein AABY22_28515, partial [Nanoarchaeota archaeon]